MRFHKGFVNTKSIMIFFTKWLCAHNFVFEIGKQTTFIKKDLRRGTCLWKCYDWNDECYYMSNLNRCRVKNICDSVAIWLTSVWFVIKTFTDGIKLKLQIISIQVDTIPGNCWLFSNNVFPVFLTTSESKRRKSRVNKNVTALRPYTFWIFLPYYTRI